MSSALINYYLADFATPPPNFKHIKYTNYITIYSSRPMVAELFNGLSVYLLQVFNCINKKKLTASTTATTFTPDSHEHQIHRQVKLADQVLPLKKKPKVLGVMLDTHLTFTQHCNNIAANAHQRNNVLKALAGSIWGCDKETLLTTYHAIVCSILSYCCPVWTPSLKDTNWSRPQWAQNFALSISIGCLKCR